MNIVKVLQNVSKVHPTGLDRDWGLGEDGELYHRLRNSRTNFCGPWSKYDEADFGITLREMKLIVKEFGHLVVFT